MFLVLAFPLALTFLVPAYAADMVSAEKEVRSLVRHSVTAEEFQALEQDVQFLDENGMGRQMLTSIEKINGKENFILSALAAVVDALGDDDPTTGAASFIRNSYTHATKGDYVSSDGGMHLGVYKVVFNCYSKTNYAGYLRTCVVYQCKTLY